MATKNIDTLFSDILNLFGAEDHKIKKENIDRFVEHVREVLVDFLETRQTLGNTEPHIRLSKIGTPNRKLWYEFNRADKTVSSSEAKGEVSYKDGLMLMRFLQGHLQEALLLFLAREAGHTVEHEQATVTIGGIEGHCDSVIDGHLVDIKTASQYGYSKFEKGSLLEGDDPYGYMAQIAAYKEGLQQMGVTLESPSYFWAYNKSSSDMVLLEVPNTDMIDANLRVAEVKNIVKSDKPPAEKCYDPVPYGKTGNYVLHAQCSYCPFREECWKDANDGKGLRTFMYSKGPVHFTEVKAEPRVEEM